MVIVAAFVILRDHLIKQVTQKLADNIFIKLDKIAYKTFTQNTINRPFPTFNFL